MISETFEVPLASAERWADDLMGLAMDLSAIHNALANIGVSVRGLDPQFDAVQRMASDARRIASDLLLDFAGHGILPANPPGDDDGVDGTAVTSGVSSSHVGGHRHASAEQIQAMASVFAVTDGDEAAIIAA